MEKNEILNEITDLRERISNNQMIRSKTRRSIFNGLDYIVRFITSHDNESVISYSKTLDYTKELNGLAGLWCRGDTRFIEILENVEACYRNQAESQDLENVINETSRNEVVEETEIEESIDMNLPTVLKTMPSYFTKLRPESLEKFDVCYLPIGPVNHYCIVAKVDKINGSVFVIPITSDINNYTGYMIEKSRFLTGKAIYSLYQIPYSLGFKKFVMPYDNRGEVIKIIKNTIEHIRKNVLPRVNSVSKRGTKKK